MNCTNGFGEAVEDDGNLSRSGEGIDFEIWGFEIPMRHSKLETANSIAKHKPAGSPTYTRLGAGSIGILMVFIGPQI